MQFPKNKRIVNKNTLREYALTHQMCEMPGCNKPGHAGPHHIIYKSQGGHDRTDNLITLCQDHHTEAHGPDSKGMRERYLRIKNANIKL